MSCIKRIIMKKSRAISSLPTIEENPSIMEHRCGTCSNPYYEQDKIKCCSCFYDASLVSNTDYNSLRRINNHVYNNVQIIVRSIEKSEYVYTRDKKGKLVYKNIIQYKKYLQFV